MVGAVSFSFNGESTTNPLSIPYSLADEVGLALTNLPTVGSVTIIGMLNNGAIAEAASGATRMDFVVEFDRLGVPFNGGRLPLIQLESYPEDTLEESISVERACPGENPPSQQYEEQLVALPGVTGGTFTLGMAGESTDAIAWNASPTEITQAMMGLQALARSVENGDVFEVMHTHGRDDLNLGAAGPAWTVRFYPVELSQLLLHSEIDPATLTDRSCTARDSVVCSQPDDGATECPDNNEACVFTPGSGCAVTDQIDCTASLVDDADGTVCRALKCSYLPRLGKCTAKSGVTCAQPVDGDTQCPDNTGDCVFTPGGSCSDDTATSELQCLGLETTGVWTPNTQGS